MDIKNFIATTITEIIEGTLEASKRTKKKVGIYSSGSNNRRHVEFDVAVAVEEKSARSRKGGVNLRVLEFDAKGKNEHSNSSVSRVKFGVRISDIKE